MSNTAHFRFNVPYMSLPTRREERLGYSVGLRKLQATIVHIPVLADGRQLPELAEEV